MTEDRGPTVAGQAGQIKKDNRMGQSNFGVVQQAGRLAEKPNRVPLCLEKGNGEGRTPLRNIQA
jgi:hypothetical protein